MPPPLDTIHLPVTGVAPAGEDPTAEEASNGPQVDFVPARFIGRIGDPAAVRRKAASCFVELRARNRNRFAICRPATKGKQPYVVGEKVIKVQEKAPVRHLLCKGTLLQNPIAFFLHESERILWVRRVAPPGPNYTCLANEFRPSAN